MARKTPPKQHPKPLLSKPPAEKLIAVYRLNQRCSSKPHCYVARATAEDLITKGHARSIMRGKAIQLTMHPDQLRDQSCKMGINVIEQAHLDNNRHAHSLIAGWYFNSRGIGPNGKDYIHVKEETLTALHTLYAIAEGSYKPPVEIAGPTA